MRIYKEKKLKLQAAIMAGALVLSPAAAINTYAADSDIIHQITKQQTVTQGVTLENIIKFTINGWYNIHIMKVDLSNKYISVDTLTNMESIGKLATTKKLAAQRNAVAAVNASFFTPEGGGLGHPVGTVVQSSNILGASGNINRYGDVMASFSLSKLNEVQLDYWKTEISLTSQNGSKVAVTQYNKASGFNTNGIIVFDRKWGDTAVGATADIPDIVQMVVADGRVTQFLATQPAAAIPENGYVVVTRAAGAKILQQAFAVGDIIAMNIDTSPEWFSIKMSVSGSSVLVKDGAVQTAFSFDMPAVAKNSPKTAIGSSKDGNLLYLVTVDGRQTAGIGMSQKEMALFMQSIGAYNAVNMDGGGSTTMVARPVGSTEIQVMNSPSDGLPRGVSTAVGVFTSAPAAPLAGLVVETTDKYMFTNTSRTFTIKGYNKFNNPIQVDQKQVKWSVSGVKGTFRNNVFRPTTFGEGKITAKIGKVTASLSISVLSKPAEIILSTSSIKVPVGKTMTFSVTGINSRGYKAAIDPIDLKWSVSSKIGTFREGVFTATERGAGYIGASLGKVHAYCAVSVSADTIALIDQFEAANGSFLSYPETVTGAYSLSTEQKVSGKSSGKLTYDFMNSDYSRAAYIVFPDGGAMLNEGISKIGLQVYNDHENSGWLRAELYDAKGEIQVVDFARTMDWTGWKYVDASLDNIKLPAKLTRLYLVQTNPVADAGSIYFDDLTFTSSGYPAVDISKIPKNTELIDEASKAVSFKKATGDSFRFGVLGKSRAHANEIEKSLGASFASKINKYLDVGAVVGNGSHESITGLIKKKPVIATHDIDLKSTKAADYKYSVTDHKNSRFFKLDVRDKSLRRSDSAQWHQFLRDLKSFKGKNVFIFMQNSPEGFSDKLEMSFFKETISDYRLDTLRNVWVFYQGAKNDSFLEKGVKYISTAGYEVAGVEAGKTDAAQYALVTVKGSIVTYVYKPIK